MKQNKYVFCISAILILACGQIVSLPTSTPAPTRPIPAITVVAVPQHVTNAPKLTNSELAETNIRRICVEYRVHVREGAGTQFATLGYLSDNAPVTLLGISKRSVDGGEWVKAVTPIGVGWINSQYVCANTAR